MQRKNPSPCCSCRCAEPKWSFYYKQLLVIARILVVTHILLLMSLRAKILYPKFSIHNLKESLCLLVATCFYYISIKDHHCIRRCLLTNFGYVDIRSNNVGFSHVIAPLSQNFNTFFHSGPQCSGYKRTSRRIEGNFSTPAVGQLLPHG